MSEWSDCFSVHKIEPAEAIPQLPSRCRNCYCPFEVGELVCQFKMETDYGDRVLHYYCDDCIGQLEIARDEKIVQETDDPIPEPEWPEVNQIKEGDDKSVNLKRRK